MSCFSQSTAAPRHFHLALTTVGVVCFGLGFVCSRFFEQRTEHERKPRALALAVPSGTDEDDHDILNEDAMTTVNITKTAHSKGIPATAATRIVTQPFDNPEESIRSVYLEAGRPSRPAGLRDSSSPASATSQTLSTARRATMDAFFYSPPKQPRWPVQTSAASSKASLRSDVRSGRRGSSRPNPGHRRDFSGSAAWPRDLPMAWPPASTSYSADDAGQ